MKIVGVPPVWWEFTCEACNAVCQAEPKDVTGRPNIDSELDVVGVIPVVACGRCGKEHDVPERLLTPRIQNLADLHKRD